MRIEKISIAELSQDPANARKHNEKNIASIVASLRRFGQQKPIVIDLSNVVRAGNGTLEAARQLGWDLIDAVKTDLKGIEATAYAIADNRTAELAEWDDGILAATLEGLQLEDMLDCTGFSDDDLFDLMPDEKIVLKDVVVMAAPAMSWVLLGIPTVRFGEISADVERLAKVVTVCETTSNDG